jgi:uncharacterized protein YcbX
VRIARIGLTPLKGCRHVERPTVDLTPDGPAGDRVFCFVDRGRGRVLRTVDHPGLIATRADWDGVLLTTTLPGRTVEGLPSPTGETLKVDYWGRVAALEVVDGPWAAAYAEHLGVPAGDLVLARSADPGEVVYGAPVSLVTTSSLGLLEHRVGSAVDSAQLRATFTVDTGEAPAHLEDGWAGRRLRIGAAEVEVRSVLPRCALIDLDPVSGTRRQRNLTTLGRYRQHAGQVGFGVDAVVTEPGRVRLGDRVEGD